MQQTTFAKNETVARAWFQASAKATVLGPLAVRIATVLMGRHKNDYTPWVDAGDYVVVTDVEKVVVTGKKAINKVYLHHTGFSGGLKELNFATLLKNKPEEILRLAVKRMLPKTIQGRHQLKRLKLVVGTASDHANHKPQPLP